MTTIINLSSTFWKEYSNVKYVSTIAKLNFLEIFVRKLLGLPMTKERKDWLSDLEGSDTIIMFDSVKSYSELCKKIEETVSSDTKLIFYAWNPLCHSEDWKLLSERWIKTTFSKEDALTEGFVYMGTFYNQGVDFEKSAIKYDGYFVGIPKGRNRVIRGIADEFLKNGLTIKTRVANNLKSIFSDKYSRRIPYCQIMEETLQSRTIIEVLAEKQNAPSLRSMESIFMKKKMITTNKSIRNYDFYSPNNIFVWGEDDRTKIKDFVLSPYTEIDDDIRLSYTFENWLCRMQQL